jgi:hypothetical protein
LSTRPGDAGRRETGQGEQVEGDDDLSELLRLHHHPTQEVRVKVFVAVCFAVLVVVMPATASSTRHVSGGFQDFQASFWKTDGCYSRGASLEMHTWDVSDGGTLLDGARLWMFVSVWNNCLNESAFWAVGQYSSADFALSQDLATARLRFTGQMTDSTGAAVGAAVDLEFVPDSRNAADAFGPRNCWNPDYACNRVLRFRNGHATGTFQVGGTDYFTPWLAQTEGAIANRATTMDATVTCTLPDGVDVHECNLLEMP